MSVSDWSDTERDLFAVGSRAVLDKLERELREEWNSGVHVDTAALDADVNATKARIEAMREETRAWLQGLANGTEGSQDVAAEGRTGGAFDYPARHSAPPQQPTDPRGELAEAERIRRLPMSAWVEERQRLLRVNPGTF